ncbi:hypothetical protein ACIBI9_17945 [Nonomuraea sp. NPDC050451]|uniref:hypothetical protein n=1 Tax=Nonomuraea sp. NPDC050451 TaxID=3364364 RepID=UPI0037AB7577
MQPSPDIVAIQVTPQPVVLDTGEVALRIEVSTANATRLRGRLLSPDGTRVPLEFAAQPPPCDWLATHTLQPADREGTWQVEARSGRAAAVHEFDVDRRGAKAEARFESFDAEPRRVPRGDLVRLIGRLELVKNGASGPAAGLPVVIAFQEQETCGRRELAEAVTDDLGRFAAQAPVMESGEWRAEVRSDPEVIGAVSTAVFVEATAEQRYATQLDYAVRRAGGGTVHSGRLRGKPGASWEGLGNQRIWVFYRKPGAPSGAFNSVNKSALTRDNPVLSRGRFEVRTGSKSGGAWRVQYFGTNLAAGVVSAAKPAP